MACCPSCGSAAFRIDDTPAGAVLACATCGRFLGASAEPRLAALERELQLVREELNRLRQAVTFLSQRVR